MTKNAVLICDINAFAKLTYPKYTVWWQNPDHQDQWEQYQSGLSKTRAEKLANDVSFVFGARWFGKNPTTTILPDGEVIRIATELPKYVKVYGPYRRNWGKNDTHQSIVVIHPDGHKETIPYHRYLMEQHLGRKLDKNETVDHISRDHTDHSLSNLQILPRSDHSALDTRRVQLVDCTCQECGRSFQRSPRLIRDKAKKNRTGPFCSRSCAARYARKVQTGKAEPAPLQQHIDSTYYRRDKSIKEHASKMAAKYSNDIKKLAST